MWYNVSAPVKLYLTTTIFSCLLEITYETMQTFTKLRAKREEKRKIFFARRMVLLAMIWLVCKTLYRRNNNLP